MVSCAAEAVRSLDEHQSRRARRSGTPRRGFGWNAPPTRQKTLAFHRSPHTRGGDGRAVRIAARGTGKCPAALDHGPAPRHQFSIPVAADVERGNVAVAPVICEGPRILGALSR